MTGVFWDTIVVCLMTGLVLVTSILKFDDSGGFTGVKRSVASDVISRRWSIYTCNRFYTFWHSYNTDGHTMKAEYLFGKKLAKYYRFVYVALVMVGSVSANAFVWESFRYIQLQDGYTKPCLFDNFCSSTCF